MFGWHCRENEFRDWYTQLVLNYRHTDNKEAADRYIQALRCVEQVRGYREVRYPKMQEAKRKVESLLNQPAKPVAANAMV